MSINSTHIPVNSAKESTYGALTISTVEDDTIQAFDEGDYSHRHDFHLFMVQEKGESIMEIDFKEYRIQAQSIVYLHPQQVHRFIHRKGVKAYILAISNENLNSESFEILEDITPVKPLQLSPSEFEDIIKTVKLCLHINREEQEEMYQQLSRLSCNLLVTYLCSKFLKDLKPTANLNRFEVKTKAFKRVLERDFTSLKRPSDYADMLNISVAYLNECVKNTSGKSATQVIHERIMLEAKRLLYYTDKSIKEIATQLGYEDHAYFSRRFAQVEGLTATEFRQKNHD